MPSYYWSINTLSSGLQAVLQPAEAPSSEPRSGPRREGQALAPYGIFKFP